jgi:hypothetical protein
MRTKAECWKFLTTVGLIILCVLVVTVFGKKKKAEQLAFNLEEISAFDIDEQIAGRFINGKPAKCEDQPLANVRSYPVFKSDKPLYGSIWFTGEYGNKYSGIQYHFAIDESTGTGKGYDRLFFDLNRDLDLNGQGI